MIELDSGATLLGYLRKCMEVKDSCMSVRVKIDVIVPLKWGIRVYMYELQLEISLLLQYKNVIHI